MKTRIFFGAAAFATALLFVAPSADARTLVPGDLLKSHDNTVYYYTRNGKRCVFPNHKTYLSWYRDFRNVIPVSKENLAKIPLTCIVKYKPGIKLIKIQTDPKVYFVTKNGKLHWIKSEALAARIYGRDWNQRIDDVPPEFFVNYEVGDPIESENDYSPIEEADDAIDISTDQDIPPAPIPVPIEEPSAPPQQPTEPTRPDISLPTETSTPTGATPTSTSQAPTTPTSPTPTTSTTTTVTTSTPTNTAPSPTSSLGFSVSKQTVQPGDVITITASDTDTTSVTKIELFFDGTLVNTCWAASCSGNALIPLSGTKNSYVIAQHVTRITGKVDIGTITIPVTNKTENIVRLSVGQSTIMTTQAASAIIDIDYSISILRVDIFVDERNIDSCVTGSHQCRWSDYLSGSVGSIHTVYAVVTDTLGRKYNSNNATITIGATDSPSVTVSVAKTQIYTGETVDVTVTASDTDGIAIINVIKDGIILKSCAGGAPCTATTGPWTEAATILTFSGSATDAKGVVGKVDGTQTVSVFAH